MFKTKGVHDSMKLLEGKESTQNDNNCTSNKILTEYSLKFPGN